MDWTISTLKLCAKHELKKSYWLSLGVIMAANLINSAYAFLYYVIPISTMPFYLSGDMYDPFSVLTGLLVGVLIYLAIVILYSIFVSSPIQVGVASFFINAPRGQRRFENLFFAFKKGRFFSTVKAMFARDIRLFLWALLSIVPVTVFTIVLGYSEYYDYIDLLYTAAMILSYAALIPFYIKCLQWYMVPYIVADNPDIDPKDALELSTRMTDGQKGKMFGLMLSFIGWYILGYFVCCIGIIFVTPYPAATFAHLYFARKGEVPVDASLPYPPYPQYPPQNYGFNSPQPGFYQDSSTDTTPN